MRFTEDRQRRLVINKAVAAVLVAITYFALGWWMGSLYS